MAKAWPNVTKLGGAPISVPWMGARAPSDSAGIAETVHARGRARDRGSEPEPTRATTTVSVAEGATATAEVTLTEPVPKSN